MNWQNQQVLVTGGAGFIGSHLVQHLLSLGARVRVLDDLSTGLESNLALFNDQIEFLEGDIRYSDTCVQATTGCEVVFHQAALGSVPRSVAHPAMTTDVNVQGSAQIFAAAVANSVRQVVYASSSSVYGSSKQTPKREGNEGRPLSPYAASKAAVECIAHGFDQCYQTGFFGLRYFNVFGPRQNPEGPYAAVVPRFVAAALSEQPMVVFGDGTQTRDFTFVEDAVAANILAATAPSGHVVNIAGGQETSVLELATTISQLLGVAPNIQTESERVGDVKQSIASLERATNTLGYKPSFSLRQGLKTIISDYRPGRAE